MEEVRQPKARLVSQKEMWVNHLMPLIARYSYNEASDEEIIDFIDVEIKQARQEERKKIEKLIAILVDEYANRTDYSRAGEYEEELKQKYLKD